MSYLLIPSLSFFFVPLRSHDMHMLDFLASVFLSSITGYLSMLRVTFGCKIITIVILMFRCGQGVRLKGGIITCWLKTSGSLKCGMGIMLKR